ncbi:hypothetical protein XELAEV_18011831mg [Xenopus laevis]|uniref:Uncharacterized protein n=1 Tax=Xenopus laevis TaxID=8355 RepID=A0A974DML0_XENLA|nr:hypothetical protein XELAEV_18011831mg [Xenopus laevis]
MSAEPCLKVTELSLHMRLFTSTPQVQKLHFLLNTHTHTHTTRVLPPHMSPRVTDLPPSTDFTFPHTQTLHLPLLPPCGSVTDHLSLHTAAPPFNPTQACTPCTLLVLSSPCTLLFPPMNMTCCPPNTHRAKHSPPSIRHFSVHTCCHTKSHQKTSPLLTHWSSPPYRAVCMQMNHTDERAPSAKGSI